MTHPDFQYDPETPITTKVLPRVAHVMHTEMIRYADQIAQEPDASFPELIVNQMKTVAQSLAPIATHKDNEYYPWTLPLADMRTAMTWIARIVCYFRENKAHLPVDELLQETTRMGKEIAQQIIQAGHTEFVEFLDNVAPGFMMEIRYGVDPLLGSVKISREATEKPNGRNS